MPTGYTADVQDGKITTLEQFAWQCARAFGACITMRDDPSDAEIPERFEPETKYHDAAIASAEGTIALLESMTEAEAEQAAAEQYEAENDQRARYRNEKAEYRQRYTSMLEKVNAWRVNPELAELRKFMLEQLQSSIESDCSEYPQPTPEKLSGATWKERRLVHERQSIAYHKAEREKEIQRTAGRNAWLAQLRADLLAA
jgi:hypothetical protein